MDRETRENGADMTLTMWLDGSGSIPLLKAAALDEARALYGEDAQLQLEGVSDVANVRFTQESGRFTATVLVRCLNLPEEDR